MRKHCLALSLVAFVVPSAGLLVHGGHDHVMGTVKAVDASHVEVTRDGKTTSVLLTPGTKFFRGTAAATAADLKVGLRVVIDAVKKGTALEAAEIKIGVPETAKPAAPTRDPAKPQ